MLVLPIELLLIIVEEAQYDDLVPRYKWLKAFSLVCRAWRAHAQRLLYAHVVLPKGANHCKAFKKSMAALKACDPNYAARLGASVQTLKMTMDHQEIYADILDLCPNLQELHAILHHASFRPEVLRRLAHAPKIRTLRVRSDHPRPLFQLLPLFPTVEYLEIDCNATLDPREFDGIAPLSWGLRELRYSNLRDSSHEFLEWLLPTSVHGTLSITHTGCPFLGLSTLQRVGVSSALRSLSIWSLQATDDLSIFPNLREFAVAYSTPHLPSAIRKLPTGVVHFMLDAMRREDCVAVADGLVDYQKRSHGSLRVLSYNSRREASLDPLVGAKIFYGFCDEWNVEFRFTDPHYGSYLGEDGPLGQDIAFPRPIPLSSRRPVLLAETGFPWTSRREHLARRFVRHAGRALKVPFHQRH